MFALSETTTPSTKRIGVWRTVVTSSAIPIVSVTKPSVRSDIASSIRTESSTPTNWRTVLSVESRTPTVSVTFALVVTLANGVSAMRIVSVINADTVSRTSSTIPIVSVESSRTTNHCFDVSAMVIESVMNILARLIPLNASAMCMSSTVIVIWALMSWSVILADSTTFERTVMNASSRIFKVSLSPCLILAIVMSDATKISMLSSR